MLLKRGLWAEGTTRHEAGGDWRMMSHVPKGRACRHMERLEALMSSRQLVFKQKSLNPACLSKEAMEERS